MKKQIKEAFAIWVRHSVDRATKGKQNCSTSLNNYPAMRSHEGKVSHYFPWQISYTLYGSAPNHVYFVPLAVLVDVFLGTRRLRRVHTQTSKGISRKWPSLSVRPVTRSPRPIKVKYAERRTLQQAILLVNTATGKSPFQQVNLPGVVM